MLKCVIFDMDGTIANTLPLCIAAFRRSIESLTDTRLTDQEIINTFGPSEEGTIAALIPDHFRQGVALYLNYYEELHNTMCPRPFKGMDGLFDLIERNGVSLALVTGKGRQSLDITLRLFQLEGRFAVIESGKATGPSKPEGIRRVLQAMKLHPDEALYIGDVSSDILAARAAAVPIMSAAWSETADLADLRTHNPDQLCCSVEEAAVYLKSLFSAG